MVRPKKLNFESVKDTLPIKSTTVFPNCDLKETPPGGEMNSGDQLVLTRPLYFFMQKLRSYCKRYFSRHKNFGGRWFRWRTRNECAIQDRMQSDFEMRRSLRSNSKSLFKTILIETNRGVYRTIDNDAKTQITTVGILRKEVVKWEEWSRWIRRNAQRKEPRFGESDWIVWNIFKTLILPLGESKILKLWKTVTHPIQWSEFGLCEDKQDNCVIHCEHGNQVTRGTREQFFVSSKSTSTPSEYNVPSRERQRTPAAFKLPNTQIFVNLPVWKESTTETLRKFEDL